MFISLGFTFQLSTRGNVLLKPGKSYHFYDGSRKDLLASYGIIKESVSGNLGHDSGKCFCPRFVSNMCPAGVLSAMASLRGGSVCYHPLSCKRGGGRAVPRACATGEGDRERGRLLSRDRGITPGYAVREGLKYGFKQYFHASCKA